MIDFTRINDFTYYAPNFLRIKSEVSNSVVPLDFNPTQLKLHQVWEQQKSKQGMIRLLILKARRQGMSTYVEGRLFHQTVTNPNTNSLIMTHDKQSLVKLFEMSKFFWESLPPQLRPMKERSNATELIFRNPKEKERLRTPGLNSLIEVYSAGTKTATRGGGYNFAHFSEVAFYEDAKTLTTSARPSITNSPGTVIIYESTGNGRQGFFYEEWQKAKRTMKGGGRKESNFIPLFFSWMELPTHALPFHSIDERNDFMSSLDEEEKYVREKFKATAEQLNWRRDMILDLGGDVEKFHQEYPCDEEEAFIAKGTPLYAKKTLLELATSCISPTEVGEYSVDGFHLSDVGLLKIWERPKPGLEYVLAADSGAGLEGRDYSTIQILKIPTDTSPFVEQVAEFRQQLEPVEFSILITRLATWYNNALAVPETTGAGLATVTELKQLYWNIYQWEYVDRLTHSQTKRLGWDTGPTTKPLMTKFMGACLAAKILKIRSEELVEELFSFVRNTTGSGEADYNCHDDLAICFMIALFVVGHTTSQGNLLERMGMYKQGKMEEAHPKTSPTKVSSLDRDLHFIGQDDLVTGGDQSWLSY